MTIIARTTATDIDIDVSENESFVDIAIDWKVTSGLVEVAGELRLKHYVELADGEVVEDTTDAASDDGSGEPVADWRPSCRAMLSGDGDFALPLVEDYYCTHDVLSIRDGVVRAGFLGPDLGGEVYVFTSTIQDPEGLLRRKLAEALRAAIAELPGYHREWLAAALPGEA